MRRFAIHFLTSFLFITTAVASILPPNNLQIPTTVTDTGLTFDQYNNAIDRVEAVYRREIESLGIKFTVNRLWDDPKVNAGTYRNNNEWVINLYGGYARHPLVTTDAYMMVICHELGHQLGGSPQKIFASTGKPGWASAEGQSDYFASLKCLRRVFEKEDNARVVDKMNITPTLRKKCNSAFSEKNDVNICLRTGMAGLVTATISSNIGKNERPNYEKQDAKIVEQAYDEHPGPQCRLDTYFQGAICEVHYSFSLSSKNESTGTCHQDNGHTQGLRPTCWFKPKLIAE